MKALTNVGLDWPVSQNNKELTYRSVFGITFYPCRFMPIIYMTWKAIPLSQVTFFWKEYIIFKIMDWYLNKDGWLLSEIKNILEGFLNV